MSGVAVVGRVACKVWETSLLSGARPLTNRIALDLMSWLIRISSYGGGVYDAVVFLANHLKNVVSSPSQCRHEPDPIA